MILGQPLARRRWQEVRLNRNVRPVGLHALLRSKTAPAVHPESTITVDIFLVALVRRQRERARATASRMGSGAARVTRIGRAVLRTYLAVSAQDGR
jgi:hypothetical protein